MWADTLLRAEQQHALRLLVWSALSIVAATSLAVLLAARRDRSPLLKHFGIQLGAWGIVIGIIAAYGWRHSHLRDASSMTRLDRLLWMNVGLDAGYTAVGIVLALTGWYLARKLAVVGAGAAVVLHGLALLLIDLQFAAAISR